MATLLAARTARRLALLAAAAAALLVGAELALRVARIGAPAWHHPDPVLGWSLRPFARGYDGGAYAEINAFGQRDALHDADKRDGVYRIAVLGNEFSEAIGVSLRDTWWRQLPPQLDRCGFEPGRKIEVLNFGVAGYSTAQEWLVLQSGVMRYQPDLVLLQLSSGKDVRENSRALASRLDRPFYRLDARGRLHLDDTFLDRGDFERRSQFRYEVARELSDRSRVLQVLKELAPIGRANADGQPSPNARWEDAWRVTEALLQRMRDYTMRNGARFALVAEAEPRLAAFGERHGIPVIALAPARPRARDVASHRAAAQAVAAGLCTSAGSPASPDALSGR